MVKRHSPQLQLEFFPRAPEPPQEALEPSCSRCGAVEDHDCRCYLEESHEPSCPCIEHTERVERRKRVPVSFVSFAQGDCTCGMPGRLGPYSTRRIDGP